MSLLNFIRMPRTEPTSADPRSAVMALGGGGARGVAHLGVMQAIGEAGIRTERIVGVSMGSLVGAMCASDPDILRVQAKAIELLHSPVFQLKQEILFGAAPAADDEAAGGLIPWYGRIRKYLKTHRKLNRAVTSQSLISEEPLVESIEYLIPDIDIEDLPIPLSIVTVDLLTGQQVVLEQGPLRLAVRASASIPGIFPPVKWNDMLLSDIGVIASVPTLIANSYASDLTIAVDVGQDHDQIQQCNTAIEVMMRVDDLGERMLRRFMLDAADLVVRPDVGNIAWFDFTEPERLIHEGHAAAHRVLQTMADHCAA
ncbi:MAG: patatin-like phospholipase family protein [Planctomycetota bacterium]